MDELLGRLRSERGLEVPLHVDAASGGFVWPFLYPDEVWDFRLESVRSINVSGHKFGMVYPGIGWLVFREPTDLPEDLVFYENYLGETDATFTLNFSTGSSMVLAQYYNFCRFGHSGYQRIMEAMAANAHHLAERLADTGKLEVIGGDRPQLPLVCFRLAGEDGYDEFDLSSQLASKRGWMVPAYTLPPDAEEVTVMRALVKENVGHAAAETLVSDLGEAFALLAKKGGVHEDERGMGQRGPGY
ncbi:MAG: pyridoxal-dependent decarboxylase [Solirubrobacterales bacterium]